MIYDNWDEPVYPGHYYNFHIQPGHMFAHPGVPNLAPSLRRRAAMTAPPPLCTLAIRPVSTYVILVRPFGPTHFYFCPKIVSVGRNSWIRQKAVGKINLNNAKLRQSCRYACGVCTATCASTC